MVFVIRKVASKVRLLDYKILHSKFFFIDEIIAAYWSLFFLYYLYVQFQPETLLKGKDTNVFLMDTESKIQKQF